MRPILAVLLALLSSRALADRSVLDTAPASVRTAPAGGPLDAQQVEKLLARKNLVEQSDSPEGGVKTVSAVTIIDASPAQIFHVLRDYAHFPEFMPYLKSATVDEHVGKRWLVSYVIRGPMGIGDRDYQLDVHDEKETVDGVEVLVSRQAYTKKGNIADTRAVWKLVPLDGGKATLVHYTTRTDIGGSFPQWMKNKTAAGALPKVLEAIRQRAPSAPKP